MPSPRVSRCRRQSLMDLVQQALRATPQHAAAHAETRRGLVAGAAGTLGSALLERALGSGRFAAVSALVVQPIEAALRGFEPLDFAGWQRPLRSGAADTAWIVFDRERHANGREAAFYRPSPEALLPLARWLHAGGVRRLVIVLPHAPGLLPHALRSGLASLDEHAVAALGFEQLVIVRSAQDASRVRAATWMLRMVQLWLAQLRFMIPQREQPVRVECVAALAVEIAVALSAATPGTRVASPELIWQAAQQDDLAAFARRWLGSAEAGRG